MSRKEKIQIIRDQHPKLYKTLEENIPSFLESPDTADTSTILSYNSFVSFYFRKLYEPHLEKMLSIGI